ncbi:MAG: hypothetical protein M0P47_04210 [Bacteroidales bacterium]|nr:hypothetical protein [Bacteroidales bacterium]
MIFPAFQKEFNPIISKSLKGAFTPAPKPAASCSAFMNGSFQQQYRQNIEDSVGFRPDFVRLYNQIDFSLFSIAHADQIVVGKNNELFSKDYIDGYLGKSVFGKRFMDDKIRMLKYVQNYLWETKRIMVIVMIPPDKGSFYPELIPDRFLKMERHQTNRDYFTKKAHEAGINVLDFNPYFSALKHTSRYRLIPSTGIHWSDYGSYLAADSAIRYFEKEKGIVMPKMILDSIQTSTSPRNLDDDINKTMNLIWNAPHEILAYPCYHFVTDTTRSKPAALFIADSYIWGWYHQPIIKNLFRNQEIWYYDYAVYPESQTKMKYTWEINLREAIERQDFVILFQVGAGNGNPGAGIIDRLYTEYDTTRGNPIRKIENEILKSPSWLSKEKQKATERKLPLAIIVRSDAINLYNTELLKKK